MDIVKKFSKFLLNIQYPNKNDAWNIAGTLLNSNEFLRFDVRDMLSLENNKLGKKIKTNNIIDKVVFELEDKWVIIDQKELNKFLFESKLKIIELDILIKKFEWTKIIFKK